LGAGSARRAIFAPSAKRLPKRDHIGIFNRSCYEKVLVVRVHPEALAREDIRSFERYLARNGTRILKFHLRLSRHA
jgi:polyphosphate kinase 2 (PPK2 family)